MWWFNNEAIKFGMTVFHNTDDIALISKSRFPLTAVVYSPEVYDYILNSLPDKVAPGYHGEDEQDEEDEYQEEVTQWKNKKL